MKKAYCLVFKIFLDFILDKDRNSWQVVIIKLENLQVELVHNCLILVSYINIYNDIQK